MIWYDMICIRLFSGKIAFLWRCFHVEVTACIEALTQMKCPLACSRVCFLKCIPINASSCVLLYAWPTVGRRTPGHPRVFAKLLFGTCLSPSVLCANKGDIIGPDSQNTVAAVAVATSKAARTSLRESPLLCSARFPWWPDIAAAIHT